MSVRAVLAEQVAAHVLVLVRVRQAVALDVLAELLARVVVAVAIAAVTSERALGCGHGGDVVALFKVKRHRCQGRHQGMRMDGCSAYLRGCEGVTQPAAHGGRARPGGQEGECNGGRARPGGHEGANRNEGLLHFAWHGGDSLDLCSDADMPRKPTLRNIVQCCAQCVHTGRRRDLNYRSVFLVRLYK